MRPLGKVVNFSPKGSLVIKGSSAPPMGAPVVDRKGTPLGKVIRITGPVKAPYVLVRFYDSSGVIKSTLPGMVVYLGDRERNRRSSSVRGRGYEGRSPRRGDRNDHNRSKGPRRSPPPKGRRRR